MTHFIYLITNWQIFEVLFTTCLQLCRRVRPSLQWSKVWTHFGKNDNQLSKPVIQWSSDCRRICLLWDLSAVYSNRLSTHLFRCPPIKTFGHRKGVPEFGSKWEGTGLHVKYWTFDEFFGFQDWKWRKKSSELKTWSKLSIDSYRNILFIVCSFSIVQWSILGLWSLALSSVVTANTLCKPKQEIKVQVLIAGLLKMYKR